MKPPELLEFRAGEPAPGDVLWVFEEDALYIRSDTPDRIAAALAIVEAGVVDGDHHKMWIIDQMVRALTGDGYAGWVVKYSAGEDGPNTYEWDEGIAP